MEVDFKARQEAQEARWQAKRENLRASLDTALSYMQTVSSAIGLSPLAMIPTLVPPPLVQLTPVRNLTIISFLFVIVT